MSSNDSDTIVAVSTPPGIGAIGIVRVSGPAVPAIAKAVLGRIPAPRHATLCQFSGAGGDIIDQGVAIYFTSPASYTGEPVLELQGHGGVVVNAMLTDRIIGLGARAARPGEFSERAFLNDKLDLAQAEAVADVINSATHAAARAALRSLRGDFSERVNQIADAIAELRVFVEADMDFPDEELELLGSEEVVTRIAALNDSLKRLIGESQRGVVISRGIDAVLCGAPNVGKSSLLNVLTGEDRAIVSAIAGTTRDVISDQFQIHGLVVRITDTAGLRDSADEIEREGVKRATQAIQRADLLLVMIDDADPQWQSAVTTLPQAAHRILVVNKCDLSARTTGVVDRDRDPTIATVATQVGAQQVIAISAHTGAGIDTLCDAIYAASGLDDGSHEPTISARARHVSALEQAAHHVRQADQLRVNADVPEVVAEELRLAHEAIGEIVGRVSSEDLLGLIFAGFCIGK